ncbi:DMT family transporter [Ferruginibacter sp.]
MGWLTLLLAGLFEVGFTTSMHIKDWSLRPWPSSRSSSSQPRASGSLAAMQSIPIGLAYAAWSGIGAAGTVVLGVAYYGEPMTALRALFLMLLVGAIIGLKFVLAFLGLDG